MRSSVHMHECGMSTPVLPTCRAMIGSKVGRHQSTSLSEAKCGVESNVLFNVSPHIWHNICPIASVSRDLL